MHKTNELRQQRAALISEIRAIQSAAANGVLTSEQLTRVHGIESEVERLGESIALSERQSQREAELNSVQRNRVVGSGAMQHPDLDRYSLVRAIHLAASGRFDGLEAEVSQEEARQNGRAPEGIYIPLIALADRRDLTASGGSNGSEGGALFTPATGHFIDALRPRLVMARLGATLLGGLSSDVRLPRQGAASAATWKGETASVDEQSPTFDQVALTPKRVGAFTELSKQLLVQTSGSVESLVRNDLLSAIATAIDQAGISGSGVAPIPRGILSTSGIGDVAIGANGGAPTFNHLVDLLAAIANADADIGTISFLSNPKVRAKLQKTVFDAGSGLTHLDKALTLGRWEWSTSVPSNLTKGTSSGVCSAIVAGDFSQTVIGQFGTAADVVVDPYTKAVEGITRVVVHAFADIAVRRAAFYAAVKDATTT